MDWTEAEDKKKALKRQENLLPQLLNVFLKKSNYHNNKKLKGLVS